MTTVRRPAAAAEQPVDAALTADLALCRDGDDAAFARVYRAVQPGLMRYLGVLVGAEVDDVAAETWAQACRDLPRFSGDIDAFRAWIATIGRHRALDHLRARRRRPAEPMSHALPWVGEMLAAPDDTAADALDAHATARAMALIATLPREQAEAVVLRAVLGLDAAAAGRVLGKRPGAVRTAAYRGLRTLQERLAECDVFDDPGADEVR
jgi:RNA polymerase sigma-70 factor (ECF subfamily)